LSALPARAGGAILRAVDPDNLVLTCDTTILAGSTERTLTATGPTCLGTLNGSVVIALAADEWVHAPSNQGDPALSAAMLCLQGALTEQPPQPRPAARAAPSPRSAAAAGVAGLPSPTDGHHRRACAAPLAARGPPRWDHGVRG
jgi:hypothetical protein